MNAFTAMPKYESYKDTDFDWIGQVPEGWEVTKLGACLKPVSIKNKPELPLLSITREQGVIERDLEGQDLNHNFIPDDLSGYKMLRKGQFGMNKMKAWQGSYGVSDYTGIVSPAYFIFDFAKAIEPRFFNWAIRSKLYVSYFGSASDGVRIGQWDLSKDRMKAIPFILPTTCEQKSIADFLDAKTAQIDEAIAIKEKQIALLKERKQIIIQQAVTQGLNTDVPMKDSGVDWIGEIPEAWSVAKLGHLVSTLVDGTHHSPKSYDEGDYLYITSKNVKEYGVDLGDVSYISSRDHLEIYARCPVKKGDILYIKDGAMAGVATVNQLDEPFSLLSSVALIKPKDRLLADYLKIYLNSEVTRGFLKTQLVGGAMTRLTLELINKFKVVVPSIKDQENIIKHLSSEIVSIEKAIKLQLRQIEKLKEYKVTMINSAVTGKIKVA